MGLFTPFTMRDVTLPNRVVVSPMSQYSAVDGYSNDWHLVHLGRFAMGGAGLVFTEATAVTRDGRRTAGDLGLWADGQVEGLARITRFLREHGSVPGVQLGHAGRKASERRPWHGETPLDETDDTIHLARALGEVGVDMLDWSTGGIGGTERPKRMPLGEAFQGPFARAVRDETDLAAMTLGFVWDPETADGLVRDGSADLVALARELLDDPNWALHAAAALGVDTDHGMWDDRFGWWLHRRDRVVDKLGLRDN